MTQLGLDDANYSQKEVSGSNSNSIATRSSVSVQQETATDLSEPTTTLTATAPPTVRVPKRSPHHVYQCGWLRNPKLANAIFPGVNVTSLSYREPASEGIVFRDDDVMIVSCGEPCAIPRRNITEMFPGPILFVNNEPRASDCDNLLASSPSRAHGRAADDVEGSQVQNATEPAESLRGGKPKEHLVVYLSRINNPPGVWNESTFGIGTLLQITKDQTRNIFGRENRAINTGVHFLMYAQSRCTRRRERAFRRLSEIGSVHYVGRCNGGGDGYGARRPEVV